MQKESTIKKITKWVLKHRKSTTMCLVVLYIGVTFILLKYTPITSEGEIWYSLSRIQMASEISSLLFIVISSIIAVWQYYISCRNECIRCSTEKIQKSVDLIEYYKDNVLDKTVAIEFVFRESGITDILSAISRSQIKNFDTYELHTLLSEDKIKELKRIIDNEKFFIVVLAANDIFNMNLVTDDFISTDKTKETKQTFNRTKIINMFFSNYISSTLNNLEYFAMHFSHNLADESVIFQSAHQTFLPIVELLYYHISGSNDNSKHSKLYTNLIDLYVAWKEKDAQLKNSVVEEQRKAISKGASACDID